MIDILSLLQQRLQPLEGAAGPRYQGSLPPWFDDPEIQGQLVGLPAAIRPSGQAGALDALKAELMAELAPRNASPAIDLSQGDVALSPEGRDILAAGKGRLGAAPIQRNWTGPPPARAWYPTSPYTNPYVTPEYGIQSSPTNPVLEDRPPQLPPPWSESRKMRGDPLNSMMQRGLFGQY